MNTVKIYDFSAHSRALPSVVPVPDKLEPLSVAETAEREKAEACIAKGFKAWIEVGAAFTAIKEKKLYRSTHLHFIDYCKDKWHISARWFRQLVQSFAAALELKDAGYEIEDLRESQAREVAKASPGERPTLWEKSLDLAGQGNQPTAAKIREAFGKKTINQPPSTNDQILSGEVPKPIGESVGAGETTPPGPATSGRGLPASAASGPPSPHVSAPQRIRESDRKAGTEGLSGKSLRQTTKSKDDPVAKRWEKARATNARQTEIVHNIRSTVSLRSLPPQYLDLAAEDTYLADQAGILAQRAERFTRLENIAYHFRCAESQARTLGRELAKEDRRGKFKLGPERGQQPKKLYGKPHAEPPPAAKKTFVICRGNGADRKYISKDSDFVWTKTRSDARRFDDVSDAAAVLRRRPGKVVAL